MRKINAFSHSISMKSHKFKCYTCKIRYLMLIHIIQLIGSRTFEADAITTLADVIHSVYEWKSTSIVQYCTYHRFNQWKSTWSSHSNNVDHIQKNPLLINNTCSTHTPMHVEVIVSMKLIQRSFFLDFELHKWRQMFIYLLEQMVNPLIFELICLLCRLFRILEMLFDLTFWLRLYFFVIYTLNLFII